MSKDVNGVKRNYLYNNGLLMQEIVDNTRILDYSYDSAGNPVSVAYRTSLSATPIYYYYAVNSRGDVVGIYTASGSLLVVYEYDAWGNILSVKNANGVNIANPNSIANIQSLRYRGYCYDTDTGLYYLQSRYYDPVTHRFINADGLVSTGTGVLGYNMFAYCNNSPIMCFDCSGTTTLNDAQHDVAYNPNSFFNIMDISYAQRAGCGPKDDIELYLSSHRNVTYEVDTAIEPYLQFLTSYNCLINICIQHESLEKIAKYSVFIPLVNHYCVWDIKRNDPWTKTIGTAFPGSEIAVKYHDAYMTPEGVGNYTYGMLGKSLGLSLSELYAGSFVAAKFPCSGNAFYNEMLDWHYIKKGYNY